VSFAVSVRVDSSKSAWVSWLSDDGMAEGGCNGGRLLEALDCMVEARESNWVPPMTSSSFALVSDGQVSSRYHLPSKT
jgi:hypothetical protein